jgi:hypothetical protein
LPATKKKQRLKAPTTHLTSQVNRIAVWRRETPPNLLLPPSDGLTDSNTDQAPFSENWRCSATDAPPEGADPLLWELGHLRKVAQGALAHAARTRNLTATASLLRSANGLLDLLSKIEKSKAEELKAQLATAALQDERVLEDEFNQHLDRLAERMRQSEAAAPRCPQCGRAAETPVREEPKPVGPGVH